MVISEPLAETFHLREGGAITLPTPSGPQPLTIAGVFYDYRTDGPSVWMDISQFRRFWHDTHVNAVRLYLKDPARVPQVQAASARALRRPLPPLVPVPPGPQERHPEDF